jgi:hypothetical protein
MGRTLNPARFFSFPAAGAGEGEAAPGQQQACTIVEEMARLEAAAGGVRLAAAAAAVEALLRRLAAESGSCGAATTRSMAAALCALRPMLGMARGALQRVGLAYLPLARATAKLGYVAASLLAGVVQEGFCTAEESKGALGSARPQNPPINRTSSHTCRARRVLCSRRRSLSGVCLAACHAQHARRAPRGAVQ